MLKLALWADVPQSKWAQYADPNFVTAVPVTFYTAQELQDLRDGKIAEITHVFVWDATIRAAQIIDQVTDLYQRFRREVRNTRNPVLWQFFAIGLRYNVNTGTWG